MYRQSLTALWLRRYTVKIKINNAGETNKVYLSVNKQNRIPKITRKSFKRINAVKTNRKTKYKKRLLLVISTIQHHKINKKTNHFVHKLAKYMQIFFLPLLIMFLLFETFQKI